MKTEIVKRVNNAIAALNRTVDFPKTNRPSLQQVFHTYYITDELISRLSRDKRAALERIKDEYADELRREEQVDDAVYPYVLEAKYGVPRELFDKEVFIRNISEQYNIPAVELSRIAQQSIKKSAAPLKIKVGVQK